MGFKPVRYTGEFTHEISSTFPKCKRGILFRGEGDLINLLSILRLKFT